jgi:hypothetical protein
VNRSPAEEVLALPTAADEFRRADLIFTGVDHRGPSYQVRVLLVGLDGAGNELSRQDAGSYFVLGHGGCFGDEGHCDIRDPVSEYDYRPPHQLTAATRVVVVTGPLRGLIEAGAVELRVEITPVLKESPFTGAASAEDITPATDVELRLYL